MPVFMAPRRQQSGLRRVKAKNMPAALISIVAGTVFLHFLAFSAL